MKRSVAILTAGAIVMGASIGVFAGEYKATMNGAFYQLSGDGAKIAKIGYTTRSLLSAWSTNKGSQLVYINNGLATNFLAVFDRCGSNVYTVLEFVSDQAVCTDLAVKGNRTERVCASPILIPGGASGMVVCDLKMVTNSAGTSVTLKCSGTFSGGTNIIGTISITASSAFKPASDCP